jgi:hypothetical protein
LGALPHLVWIVQEAPKQRTSRLILCIGWGKVLTLKSFDNLGESPNPLGCYSFHQTISSISVLENGFLNIILENQMVLFDSLNGKLCQRLILSDVKKLGTQSRAFNPTDYISISFFESVGFILKNSKSNFFIYRLSFNSWKEELDILQAKYSIINAIEVGRNLLQSKVHPFTKLIINGDEVRAYIGDLMGVFLDGIKSGDKSCDERSLRCCFQFCVDFSLQELVSVMF